MNNRIAAIAALAAAAFILSACAKSEEQIRREERTQVEAEFAVKQQSAATPVAIASTAATQTVPSKPAEAAAAEKPSWAGKYDLRGDGSEGDVRITPAPGAPAKYKVSFAIAGVGGSGCMGGISGTAIESKAGTLAFTGDPSEYIPEEGTGVCTIELTRQANGRTIDVSEDYDRCMPWHGAACGFSGTLSRK